ncbi:MAG: peptidoglycan DD-metalloendopeptidase family protein [Pseudomonadota bacterium]|nr:MAG: peptidoglycan DD-metalloendopeptidase family protein [Pseudomonadota bacterium]
MVLNATRLLLILAALLLPAVSALPEPPTGDGDADRAYKAQELERLRERIEELRGDLDSMRGKQGEARNELRSTETRIGALIKSLRVLERKLAARQARLAELRGEQRRHRSELSEQRELLVQQVQAAYAIGRQEYMKLVLNQEDPAVVGRVFAYYDYFNRARSARIEQALGTLTRLGELERDIEVENAKLRELSKRQQRARVALESSRRARELAVSRLTSAIHNKGEELTRMLESERQLGKLLNAIQEVMPDIPEQPGKQMVFARQKGKLTWPTKGKVRALYGKRRAEGNVKWNGIIISAGEGTDVHAVSHGRVAYADWLRGYGLLLIVDHGDGYMSLYGHNQSLYKETGDWVEAGELVASVGASGGQRSAGLYFEIRHNGRPTNPLKWCRKTRRG